MSKCKCGHEEVEHVQTSIGRRLNCVICNKCDIYRPDLDAKQKKFSKSTVQYEHGKIPKDNELMEIKQDRPHCKKHGALLRYQNNIWKCINCGWSVEWVRTEKPPSASKEKDEFEEFYTKAMMMFDKEFGNANKKQDIKKEEYYRGRCDSYLALLTEYEQTWKDKLKSQLLKEHYEHCMFCGKHESKNINWVIFQLKDRLCMKCYFEHSKAVLKDNPLAGLSDDKFSMIYAGIFATYNSNNPIVKEFVKELNNELKKRKEMSK